MKHKTLVISEVFPPIHGGSGRWFFELYSRLPKSEYVIAAGKTEGDSEFDKTHDITIHRLNLSSTAWGFKSITGAKYYLKTFLALRKIIKKENITSIHCGRCLPEGVFGLLLSKLFKTQYLCYIHGEDVEAASSSRELSYIVKQVLKNAQVLISNSNNSQRILLDHWQVPPEKAVVLHPGMDANRFMPADYDVEVRNQLGWHDRIVILTVGRLQKRKGQDMLIQALPEILKHHPNLLYSIVGGGEEKGYLFNLVEHLGLKDNVQFLSEIADEVMIQCYQQCTLFVLPNRTVEKDIEGFGMVLAEAQSCGKPVLAGDSGGTAETMVIGVTGYICDCTSPTPIAIKIIDLLNAKNTFNQIGLKARSHVEVNLDWTVHSKKAAKIFGRY
jgi:phosphatidylinositol alpha-1,6-mannosyltransferase